MRWEVPLEGLISFEKSRVFPHGEDLLFPLLLAENALLGMVAHSLR